MTERGYQQEYSQLNPEMHATDSRHRKAETMRRVLADALGSRMQECRLLNLGCSTGLIDQHLAPYVSSIVGVDIDEPGIEAARSLGLPQSVSFVMADAMSLPFPDSSFDIVICSQVYEHVPDAGRMMGEIQRVLRPGGVCYFAATNRWALMEPHYRLPFLSWLPRWAANLYVRALGRSDEYYETHLGVAGLRKLAAGLRIEDWTGRILRDPERYACAYLLPGWVSRNVAKATFALAYRMFPGFIWLLWKPVDVPADGDAARSG